ncbi:hypothetical protein [Neisseria iguanae]|uniref:Phage coat protein n=1 Tax=Neisseria iguanae TaxID=90242 RepID=A0A2P7TYT3_9NEIS|nr:hypothetical protein [Neisseria iguanae]PSJ79890.1 hypothetical protein C7N83_09540 [Neisseria iguanae]
MNIQKLKRKAQTAVAAATVAVLASPVMAEGTLLETIKTEIGGLKEGVLSIGAVVVGISIAFALVRIGKRSANQVG